MDRVVIDAEVRAKLNGLDRQLTFADPSGATLGYFVPPEEYHALMLARLSLEPTPEELEAARREYREKGGKTTAEVMAHLAEVKRRWEEQRG